MGGATLWRRVGIAVIVVLALIQLYPTWLSQTNPPVLAEPAWDSAETRAIAERACFDCHSNQTNWPWYSRVAPVSWLVTRDVLHGREHLNFSEWGLGHELPDSEDFREVIENGSMPLPIYLPLHPEAQLSAEDQQRLIAGLQVIGGTGAEPEDGEGGEHSHDQEHDHDH